MVKRKIPDDMSPYVFQYFHANYKTGGHHTADKTEKHTHKTQKKHVR